MGKVHPEPEIKPLNPKTGAVGSKPKGGKAAKAPPPDDEASEASVGKPQRRRRPQQVKANILISALEVFGTYGFEGAVTRQIAHDAHVSQSLLLYHFPTKEILWRTVITDLLNRSPFRGGHFDDDTPVPDRIRALIRLTVEFFAENPQLHRLMTLEAHQPSERLIWLCENFVKEDFKKFCDLLIEGQTEGIVRPMNAARLRFAIVAMAAVPFSISAEYQYLTRHNPFSRAEIESTIELIESFVFIAS